MGTRRVDVEPDVPLLLGEYHPRESIPVTISDPVRVQELPCPDGTLISRMVPNTAVHLVKKDLRRRYVTLLSKDDDMWVGATQTEVDQSTGAFWPQLVPLTLRISGDLWVRAAGQQTIISVVSEQWTE